MSGIQDGGIRHGRRWLLQTRFSVGKTREGGKFVRVVPGSGFHVPGSGVPGSTFRVRVRQNPEPGTWNARTRNLEPGTRNVTIDVYAVAVRGHRNQTQDVLRVRRRA